MLSFFAGALLIAGLYLVTTQPTYEAKVRLAAPKSSSLFLSRPASPFATFDSYVVFNQFIADIQTGEKWKTFAADLARTDAGPAGSLGSVTAKASTKQTRGKDASIDALELVYQTHVAESAADILRRYLEFSVEQYKAALIASIKDRVEREKENIVSDIALLRQKAKLDRADAIERLRKEIELAESLDIDKQMQLSPGISGANGSAAIAANQAVSGYMRGSIALKAELEALQKRESDDAYITGLRDREIELQRLDGLRIVTEDVSPYEQVGVISYSKQPVRPDKKLVLILAAVAGLVSGALAAFFVEAVARSRANPAV